MSKEIKKYDERGNIIYFKGLSGFENWKKFDERHRIIYYKNSNGVEYWSKYDENNERTGITHQEFKQIERMKLYLNIKRNNRFELIDI